MARKRTQRWAVIPASGNSTRMGRDKLFANIAGTPVLHCTINTFLHHNGFAGVVLTLPVDRHTWQVHQIHHPRLHCCNGGASRAESVYAGLQHLQNIAKDDDQVWVHDAARPCLTRATVDQLIEQVDPLNQAAIVAKKATDSIKKTHPSTGQLITEHCDRKLYWLAQTPQIATLACMAKAYSHCLQREIPVTDEAGALMQIGETVRIIQCPAANPKITLQEDLLLAAAIIQGQLQQS